MLFLWAKNQCAALQNHRRSDNSNENIKCAFTINEFNLLFNANANLIGKIYQIGCCVREREREREMICLFTSCFCYFLDPSYQAKGWIWNLILFFFYFSNLCMLHIAYCALSMNIISFVYLLDVCIMYMPNGIARKAELDIEFRLYLWLLACSTGMAILYMLSGARLCLQSTFLALIFPFFCPLLSIAYFYWRTTTHKMNIFFHDIWSAFVCYRKKYHDWINQPKAITHHRTIESW